MVTIETLRRAVAAGEEQLRPWLLPVAAALADIPALDLDPAQAQAIARGQRFTLAKPHPPGRCAALAGGDLLALVEVDQAGQVRVLRGFNLPNGACMAAASPNALVEVPGGSVE